MTVHCSALSKVCVSFARPAILLLPIRGHVFISPFHPSPSFSLPTYFLLAPLSLYLSISPSLPPSIALFLIRPFIPSLSPLHSFLSSTPLSSHLTLSLSSMWVATTLLSSRAPWNALSDFWNFRKFSGRKGGRNSLWLDRIPPQSHISPCSTIRSTFFEPRCYATLRSVSEWTC